MAARTRRLAGVLCGLALAVPLVPVVGRDPRPAAAATSYSAPLRTAIASLKVAAENRSGYDRSKFPHWIDADGDGCDTRKEVLLEEAVVKPTRGPGCSLSGGRWYSFYDNKYWNTTSRIDIDHVVALAEAWDSGARSWTTSRRRSFANDLGDRRSLVGVTDTVNQAKGDKDPAQWLPPYQPKQCTYVRAWVAVKIRWWLTVDSAEKNALVWMGALCPNTTLTVTRTSKPSTTTTTTTRPASCSPSYPTVCIPPPPPDLDCGDVPYRNFKVVAPDPHHFDGDGDGLGCES
jgi:hypothetical protein